MSDSIQIQAVELLKERIEEKLQWGKTEQWNKYDFEKLSDKITTDTGVTLSVSTLKRIFGRVNYNSAPSLTTLNTLSRFLGYEDWRMFSNLQTNKTAESESKPVDLIPEPDPLPLAPAKNNRFVAKLVVALGLIGLLVIIAASYYRAEQPYNPADFSFRSKTLLTEGLPNSVVFDYDASKAKNEDSVFIAQSWDTRRKVLVNKADIHYSTIYYYPGYFRAKLMIGKEIMQEHDIQIKTDGWLGLIEAEWGKEPLYFPKQEITQNNQIVIDDSLLKKYNISTAPQPPPVRLFNQMDIHGIKTDNFTFKTELKANTTAGVNACQQTEVLLQAKNDILIVPLSKPACVGDISLAAYGFYTNSGKDDLSGFGCNLAEWTTLKIVCKDKHISFFINDKKVYATDIKNPPSEIVGVQYRFKGGGAVRYTSLTGVEENTITF